MLTVVASNATEVVISDNCDSNTYPLQATGGTQTVPVPNTPGTCTYTATATGAGSQTAAASVPITVVPSTATVVSMTASPLIIAAGQSVTFDVTVANANSVFITNNVTKASIPVLAGGGTVTLPGPSQTETYTVTATGANNQTSTAQVTITVMSVSITATPTTIVTRSSSTLTATAANATQVVISDNVDSTTYTLAATGGTQAVSPTVNTTYTATATNGSATATATVKVAVNATANATPINHVIFLMQENRTFDTYFGMLNKYRANSQTILGTATPWNIGDDGTEYDVDGIAGSDGVVGNFPSPQGIANPNPNPTDTGITPPLTTPPTPPPPSSYSLFKFATTCVDDMSSDWLASYGDVNRYDFLALPAPGRSILMDGFVHTAYNYAKSCLAAGGTTCSGSVSDDPYGQRAMGYYDEDFLNYYYYMASQFALSDRWFSPVSSKSTPNRIATMTGGTTQGLVYDPYNDDDKILNDAIKAGANVSPIAQLDIPTIFGKLTKAGVSWRIYYGMTRGGCTDPDGDCGNSTLSAFPSITFADFTDSYQYLYAPATKGACSATTTPSGTAVQDPENAFCIDTTHIVPVSQYFTDVANGTLPQFAFIEPAYGHNDEHPGSTNSILSGQAQVATLVNALMATASNSGYGSWQDSVFFLSYDEGGGPFDHVPPVPGHSNDFTGLATGISPSVSIPELSSSNIAVNPDTYYPCPANGPVDPLTSLLLPTLHCDLQPHTGYDDPGYLPGDAPASPLLGQGGVGFAAQLGFRLPNMVISPFTKRHYVSHVPMDHTAVIKFVEDNFIGNQQSCAVPSSDPIHCYLTQRDAAQPPLADPNLGFFDFTNNGPWAIPPTLSTNTPQPPTPLAAPGKCTPASMQ
jgi:phospholipase C